jgi:hypothetical protein
VQTVNVELVEYSFLFPVQGGGGAIPNSKIKKVITIKANLGKGEAFLVS